jgi:methionyl-tRNA formyltransferase
LNISKEIKLEQKIRFAFAGDRDISVKILRFLQKNNYKPEALLLSGPKRASHAHQLKEMCPYIEQDMVFEGNECKSRNSIFKLSQLDLDYIIGIHFPYIIPSEMLKIPKIGFLNLHPAYLPYNRGWHTPSWAIMDNTPVGATLHFMSEELDSGDIIAQSQVEIRPDDTAHTLYKKLKKSEYNLFKKCWPELVTKRFIRKVQDLHKGTSHNKQDLLKDKVQRIDLFGETTPEQLIRKLRALTTNDIREAAYFMKDGKRYRIQVKIQKED